VKSELGRLQPVIAGVSNFNMDQLAELPAMARIKAALVQKHSDPPSADANSPLQITQP